MRGAGGAFAPLVGMAAVPDMPDLSDLPAPALLKRLADLNIRITAAADRLRVTGPEALLKGGPGAAIRARKDDILRALAVSDAAATDGDDGAIPPAGPGPLPLSPAQARLWLVERIDPAAAHHLPLALEARGALDRAALDSALARIVDRHAVLRLRITVTDGVPMQHFDAPAPVAQDRGAARDADLPDLIRAEAQRPFDLTPGPPLRLTLHRLGDDRHLLLFTLHHIAADGSSVEILMRDFAGFYAQAVTGMRHDPPALPVQYGDYAAWLAGRGTGAAADARMRFWQDRLGPDLPVTRLPVDHPRPPVQSRDGALVPLRVPQALTARLRALGAAQGASLFAVLMTAFAVLVHRQTGQRDLLLGIPSANRARPETEAMVGLFVNPLPIRCAIDPARGFQDNLARLQGGLLDALDHQDVPFEHLVQTFQTRRDPGASPLFQLKFQLDRAPRQVIALPGLTLRRMAPTGGHAPHDLSLDLVDGPEGITGHLAYATALFSPDTVARLAGHYLTLLASAARNPRQPVALLDMLTPGERHDLLVTWNDSARPLDPALRFPALFEAQAAATPDAVAVEHLPGDGRVITETYGALNARANRLAHALRARGAGPDVVIGIALERGPDMVAAWLAVMKSGAAWMPLDPAYPAGRLAFMLADAGAALVLSHSHIALPDAALPDASLPGGTPRWDLDRGWPDGPADNPAPGTDPADLAYLIHTSGSTGRPKGVEITHEGLVNLTLDKLRRCDPRPGDRVMGFFSFSFDAAIPDLVMALASGARLVTAPAGDVLPGPGLARLLRDRSVTHLTITPSALACLPPDDLPALRMVLVGGEAPPAALIAAWAPGRVFINAYGPTECTVNASMVVCDPQDDPQGDPQPVLEAPANKQLHILDEALELLPVGCPGELFIGGIGLARGYRGRPDLTAAAFLPDPYGPPGSRLYRSGDLAVRRADGRIVLLGRVDDQIKLRGFRIEPGEIARCLRRLPGVEAAFVAARPVAGTQRLVAWLAGGASAADEPGLRTRLGAELPRHMIPDDLVWLDRLPLTVNGKLDSRALPDPQPRRGGGRPPEGATEQALARIFAEVLGIAAPLADDDFFDLGGNSLLATRLAALIEAQMGRSIRVMTLFDAPTIRALARHLDGAAAPATPPAPDWQADLALPADIVAEGTRAGLGGHVLLTGATGFVGVHLLAELLRDPGRRVCCLTRGDGMAAIRRALDQYALDADLARVTAITGDLSAPGLGLDPAPAAGDPMPPDLTAILHCGARVHHATPYRGLRDANVGATVALLRLAARAGCAFHLISTLSALLPGDRVLSETDAAADLPPPQGGYNLSKWVAEQLVAQAGARGMAVTIHRLGSVSGHALTGLCNPADILTRQVRGYVAAGIAPDGRALLNLLPVDHAARAICLLAADPANAGRVFHHLHSAPVSSDLLFAALAAEGHAIRRVPPAEWQALLARIAASQPDHPLYPLAALGGGQGFSGARWPYDGRATRDRLAGLPEPPLGPDLLRRYIRALTHPRTAPEQELLT